MITRCKEIILAILVSVVCPALIISALQQKISERSNQSFDTDATSTKVVKSKESYLNVLMDNEKIEIMPMSNYLVSVVLREMPASFEFEALKAQAVVARTYVLRRRLTGSKHIGADICTDASCCQGYYDVNEYISDGGTQESVQKTRSAVEETENEVLIYNGDLIDATYFSCSGGMTEDALAVWGADVPYLRATASPGEEQSVHYVDTVSFDTGIFCRKLGIDDAQAHNISINNTKYTSGGGIDTIEICGKTFKGTTVRKKLGLRSTAFMLSVVGEKVTITTKGYGHRVGMSQYGADAMAATGADYREILSHYYSGTQLVNNDNN